MYMYMLWLIFCLYTHVSVGDYVRYACGMVCEYVQDELARDLQKRLKYVTKRHHNHQSYLYLCLFLFASERTRMMKE